MLSNSGIAPQLTLTEPGPIFLTFSATLYLPM